MAKKARDQKRQTKINFSPAALSSPANIGARPSKGAAATPTKRTRAASRKPTSVTTAEASSDDDLAEITYRGVSLGMPVTTTKHGMFGSSDQEVESSATEQDDDDRGSYVRPKLASRKRRRDPDKSEDDLPKRKGKAQVTVTRAKRTRRRSPDSDQSDDKELRVQPKKRIKVTRRQRTPAEDEDDAEDDDDIEPSPPRSRRRRAARAKSPINHLTPPRNTRRKIRRRPATPSDEAEQDEDGSDNDVQQSDNRVVSGTDNQSEREDLEEDLAFLQSSPVAERGKLRSNHEKPKSKRQEALEALKRKRAGASDPASSATPARTRRVVEESESDSELEIIKEEPESDVEVMSDLQEDEEEGEAESDRDANALDIFYENEQDEDFIDDEDAGIGEPIAGPEELMALRLQQYSVAKAKDLFPHAIEWMVMKKIHPAFEANHDKYRIVFDKLDKEVKGMANSKFSSSAWTLDFTRAIQARPDLAIMDISVSRKEGMEMHCEACNRRNHPASAELTLTGQPYHPKTLEPIENDDSDSDDSGSGSDDMSELSADSEPKVDDNGEKVVYNARGERLPPESRRFALGRTCQANAQVSHTLYHWRYHLYSWVKEYLVRENYLTAEMLVKRDGWTDKKRDKAAMKIVKRMEEDGEVRRLYHKYKDQGKYASDVRYDLDNRWGRH